MVAAFDPAVHGRLFARKVTRAMTSLLPIHCHRRELLMRYCKAMVWNGRHEVMHQVIAIVMWMDQLPQPSVADHVAGIREHTARRHARVVAQLAEGRDCVKDRQTACEPQRQKDVGIRWCGEGPKHHPSHTPPRHDLQTNMPRRAEQIAKTIPKPVPPIPNHAQENRNRIVAADLEYVVSVIVRVIGSAPQLGMVLKMRAPVAIERCQRWQRNPPLPDCIVEARMKLVGTRGCLPVPSAAAHSRGRPRAPLQQGGRAVS